MSSTAANAATARPAGNILRARILSSLVLAPLALAALYAGPRPFAALIAVFMAVGAWEWARMCGTASPGLLAAGFLVLLAAGAALIWIDRGAGINPTLWLFGAVWATDIGAYAVGTMARGPRIAPSISPNKTWAGLCGGIIFTALWSVVWARLIAHSDAGLVALVAFSAGAAVIAQAGDFALSFTKRRFGVKDSSGLIPGHGGVLDRIAGLLTTGPALALLLLFGATTITTTATMVVVQ